MARIRHRIAALVGVVMLLTVMAGLGFGAASAQTTTTPTTYTPGTSVPPFCTPAAKNQGNVSVGQTFVFSLCGVFKPGSSVAITVDGQSGGPAKTAASDGSVPVTITIASQTVATVNDPTNVNVTCGANTALATGISPTGTAASQTGTFTVLCATTTATTTSTGIAFTGANVLRAVLAALVLIGVGGALVLAQRRRSSSQAL